VTYEQLLSNEGAGGDSDEEGEDAEVFASASVNRNAALDEEADDVDGQLEGVEVEPSPGETLKIPKQPADWEEKKPRRKEALGEPPFGNVDNPGGWCDFTYRPKFAPTVKNKDGETVPGVYRHHQLPTGALPVPVDEGTGKRTKGGFEFFYQGDFKREGTTELFPDPFVSTAGPDDPFPEEREGCLDEAKLQSLGLTAQRMIQGDALFFLNLLLPIGKKERDPHDIDNFADERMNFYQTIVGYTNWYLCDATNGISGSYGHSIKTVEVPELVRFFGVVVRDGAIGGSKGDIRARWKTEGCIDDCIVNSMTYSRWLEIKRIIKLNSNTETRPKNGAPGYNPAYKFDLIWEVIVLNTNYLTEWASTKLTGDETSWAFGGFGEAKSGIVKRVFGKPGVSKGGQTVIISDSKWVRVRAYLHRHDHVPKPAGWNKMGQVEIRTINEKLLPMIVDPDNVQGTITRIFRFPPKQCWDNYFSGDQVVSTSMSLISYLTCCPFRLLLTPTTHCFVPFTDWMGEKGLGYIGTCRRDRLPTGVPGKYWHKETTDSAQRCKVARFIEPIVAVKTVEARVVVPGTMFAPAVMSKPYQHVHVSMQSTSSTNFSTVNILNECFSSSKKRERGTGNNKRTWGIEMNHAREAYLDMYSRIDSIDHLIKNCDLKYRSWKYWHQAMLHALALAIVSAYDMYKEMATTQSTCFRIRKPMTFKEFRLKLGKQMLEYDPCNQEYPGDAGMRVNSKQPKAKRKSASGGKVTAEDYRLVQLGGKKSRLCGNLDKLIHHVASKKAHNDGRNCVVCGEKVTLECVHCKEFMHMGTGKNAHLQCHLHWHNSTEFGLSREDAKTYFNSTRTAWVTPKRSDKKDNADHMKTLDKSL
jgi:hypothetical protein